MIVCKSTEIEVQDSSIDLSIVFSWRLRSVIMLSRGQMLASLIPLYSPPQSTQIFSIDFDDDVNSVYICSDVSVSNCFGEPGTVKRCCITGRSTLVE